MEVVGPTPSACGDEYLHHFAGAAPRLAAGPTPSGTQADRRREALALQLRRSRLCRFHTQGRCHFGASCDFAHDSGELKEAPDLRKTRLCRAFEAGQCQDPKCAFAHGASELRSTGLFYKRTLCAWHERGTCRNGSQCRFAHSREELRSDASPQREAEPTVRRDWRHGYATRDPAEKDIYLDEPMKVVLAVPGQLLGAPWMYLDDLIDQTHSQLLAAPGPAQGTGSPCPITSKPPGDRAAPSPFDLPPPPKWMGLRARPLPAYIHGGV